MTNAPLNLRKSRSPAARLAAVARDVVEEVLLSVRRLPRTIDRPRIVSALEAALGALHMLSQSALRDPDHIDRLAAAQEHVTQSRKRIEEHDASKQIDRLVARIRGVERALESTRDDTIGAIVRDQQGALDGADNLSVKNEERPFSVSGGAPEAFEWTRPPMRIHADVLAPGSAVFDERNEAAVLADPANTTSESFTGGVGFAEDDDEIIDGPDVVRRLEVLGGRHFEHAEMATGAKGEVAQLKRIARDCFEELGAMWTVRQRLGNERFAWKPTVAFEARMLRSLDALIALGTVGHSVDTGQKLMFDVLEETIAWSNDGPTTDAHRSFVRAFVLGNVEGEDTARALVAALKQSTPYTYNAQRDAMGLSTNKAVAKLARRLVHDDETALVSIALDVLLALDIDDEADALLLLDHPRSGVRCRAAALLSWGPRKVALGALAEHMSHEVDDDVVLAAAEAMTRQGSDVGTVHARRLLTDELDDPHNLFPPLRARLMQLLAVAGGAEDGGLLDAHFDGSPEHCLALGAHGHIGHVDTLLQAISPELASYSSPNQRHNAAAALLRITGAPLSEERAGHVSDQYVVRSDSQLWTEWWHANRANFEPNKRYRFGKAYDGRQTTEELSREEVPLDVRRILSFELNTLLGKRALNTGDYAAQQVSQLRSAHDEIVAAVDEGGDGLPRLGADGWLALERTAVQLCVES